MSALTSPSAAVLLLVSDPDKVEPLLPGLLPGRSLRTLRRESLGGGPVGLARRLGALGVDEIVLLTDDLDFHERLWRLQAIGALPLAPKRYLLDLRGRRLVLSVGRFAVRDLPMLVVGLLGSGTVLWRTRRQLDRLLQAERHRPRPVHGRRVVFLRSDLWSGVPAGGSVAHTSGVASGFAALGADLSFISTSAPALVDPAKHPAHLVPPSRRYNIFREVPYFAHAIRFLNAARRRLSDAPADLLYQRFDPANWAGVALARERSIPLVLEYNGSEVWIADHWDRPFKHRDLFVKAETANLRHADLIVVVSEVLRQGLADRGIEPERLVVRPNAVDTDRYRPDLDGGPVRRRLELGEGPVVGFVGTFGIWHGAPVLARAARRVLRERPHARFLFVGDGRDRRECEAILADERASVRFTGLVPQDEGPGHLAAMDILAAPHVDNPDGTRFFGSPTKLFEYMAMGRGIVASRLEQIGDVLEDGATALLVPPGDDAALARAVVRLVDDAALRARLGAAARERALERHTWTANVRGVVERLRDRGLLLWD
ncbi:MAG TPA: glycosyltransferase family 4 protein [Candidatus Polarisedimenticolia bacterium]|nr:glycosyltransferase family 4 protein [Candidatus Polarisedimenticolia bacterium]